MITVPSFLLKRLYVKGSLRNAGDGLQFELKNTLGSGYAIELLPLTVDGNELPRKSSYLVIDDREVAFSAISQNNPLTLAMNRALMVLAKGVNLAEGPHKIAFGFVAQGLGRLGFEVTDHVSGT